MFPSSTANIRITRILSQPTTAATTVHQPHTSIHELQPPLPLRAAGGGGVAGGRAASPHQTQPITITSATFPSANLCCSPTTSSYSGTRRSRGGGAVQHNRASSGCHPSHPPTVASSGVGSGGGSGWVRRADKRYKCECGALAPTGLDRFTPSSPLTRERSIEPRSNRTYRMLEVRGR